MKIRKLPIRLEGDDRRVIARPFILSTARVVSVLQRIDQLPESEIESLLVSVHRDYATRHRRTDSIFAEHYHTGASLVGWKNGWSHARKLLAGSYFTMEYSVDSAALFNPSIVLHPDQSDVPTGAARFVMSLRATGEGHVSSVVFRTGLIGGDETVILDPPPPIFHRARISPDRSYQKALFARKLKEMGVRNPAVTEVLNRLPETFDIAQLRVVIDEIRPTLTNVSGSSDALRSVYWLASSNYHIDLAPDATLAEVVLFPMSEEDRQGIEDLRLVRFVEEDGGVIYYGTYTAYDGVRTLPMMLATRAGSRRIEIHSLNGASAANKGMALFPRKIDGHYVMCSRIDGENLYISFSDYEYFWESAKRLVAPRFPWEFVQIGNCGSPLETEAGWLLLTHGVGPMRTYAIGAILLDLHDPLRVIGQLPRPLLVPEGEEREGYVPNVVYTCGAMIHERSLYIPYAQADKSTSMAIVDLGELLEQLTSAGV